MPKSMGTIKNGSKLKQGQKKYHYIYYNTGDFSYKPYVYEPNSSYTAWQMIIFNNFEVSHPVQSKRMNRLPRLNDNPIHPNIYLKHLYR